MTASDQSLSIDLVHPLKSSKHMQRSTIPRASIRAGVPNVNQTDWIAVGNGEAAIALSQSFFHVGSQRADVFQPLRPGSLAT